MTQSPESSSKVDVHVHSKHSDRPSEWFLRRIGSPESFVEPIEVYRRAKERGMDFVTISDHNCIEGALEIAHLDGVFLSNEVTTYLPEDGCKLHLLALGITEEQFRFMVAEIFERLIHEREDKPSVSSRVRGALGRSALRRNASEIERQLLDQLSSLAAHADETQSADGHPRDSSADWRTFRRASRVAHLVGFDFFDRLFQNLGSGRLLDACQAFASLAPVGLGIAPYLTAFATQHKDESFLREVAEHFPWAARHRQKTGRICWMTDTFGDVNGVAKMIQILGEEAGRQGIELEVLTCEQGSDGRPWRKNFQPVGTFRLPEYDAQELAFPPFLEIAETIESRGYDEIIISTPGPMGLLGLLCAKLLGLRTVGIYHTDFPAYVEALTDNRALAGMTRSFMLWFYDQMDTVEVPSEAYRTQLLAGGLSRDKLRLLRRGVDTRRFDPARRDLAFWRRFESVALARSSGRELLRLLTVSRLSHEKNLHHLLAELRLLRDCDWVLYVVGDGPARDELAQAAAGLPVVFTGFLEGDDLANAYASSDLFVFPSVTDTFGNVVLEAQASGLPCVVSRQGGPAEIIVPGQTGLAASTAEAGIFAQAVRLLLEDDELRREMATLARTHALRFSCEEVVRALAGRDEAGERIEETDREPASSSRQDDDVAVVLTAWS
ncbi:MAG TPA: glycosyltransferase [Thermoanaerobaculia bacterium]|nr:glycosyltransferase [Thermoanaerobaculia bacterium]